MGKEFNSVRVAVIKDQNGKCKYVGKVRFVDDQEFNKLQNESNKIDAEKVAKKKKLQDEINELKEELAKIKQELKVLKGEE